ncbi:hypothetical protein [Agreia sp. Leaf283]|uniref:hypothetical protein n=1 Tax=Agreia sp. Leaf283 TaxID=1736321 RepID=UPI0006FC20AC|nr:hypothetical protein [Agreia sp. Leaf283]KQP55885.1 hypothetical protein ASF51_12125 [Agreia sp. Leaf283]
MTTSSYTSADMSARLWDASRREARFIVENHTSVDEHIALRVALSFGLATEYLVMSALASLDVALLADDKNAYSKIALSKAGEGSPIAVAKLRTVVWGVAVKLLNEHEPYLRVPDIESVMNVRNAAAHVAMVSREGTEDALTKMLTIVQALHRYLSAFEEDDYWGPDCVPVVHNLRDEHANKMRATYDVQILAARARLRVLDSGISQGERDHVYATLEERTAAEAKALNPDLQAAHFHACPACTREGITIWNRYVHDDFENQETYESAMGNDAPDVTASVSFDAVAFLCLVCGLKLSEDGVAVLLEGETHYIAPERHVLTDDERSSYLEASDSW